MIAITHRHFTENVPIPAFRTFRLYNGMANAVFIPSHLLYPSAYVFGLTHEAIVDHHVATHSMKVG
jgi:hypothetical protein